MSAAEVLCTREHPKAAFSPLFEHAPLALVQCQSHGRIAVLNPVSKQMFGVNAGTAVRVVDLLDSQDRGVGERLISELLDGERDSFQIESRIPGVNSRPVRWTAWRAHGIDGGTACVLALAQEVAAVPVSDQRLKHAERLEAVGRLAGGVAHDFNNLLTGVLLYCDLLMVSLEQDHRARKYAEEIRKAGMQASGLVRQLLAVTRPTSSVPRPLSLNEISDGMRNLLVRLIGENIELQFRLDPNLGLITIDPTQAQQILLNLVLNARDAMPRGGRITVETSNSRIEALIDTGPGATSKASLPCALFAVEDNGSGMDGSTRAHLFEPFFTTKAGKGTGLGLATVHDIVTTNGGLIHVASQPAKGTRVTVLLPLAPEALPEALTAKSFHPVGDGELFSSKEEE
jgi:two-component system, cell cycle sensor histidine kinase and response regulator CckA